MMSLSAQIRFCTRAQLVLTGSLFVMAAAFFFFGYQPMTHRLNNVQASIDAKEEELNTNLNKDQILQSVKQQVNKLLVQLDGTKRLPRDEDIAGFYKDATRVSQDAQLASPPKYNPDKKVTPCNDLFSKFGIQIQVQGNFSKIASFVREMESLPRLTRVKTIEMRSDPAHPGIVTADMTMELYFSADQQ